MKMLEFRNASHADIDAIVALVECTYRGDASRVGWTTEADLLDGMRIDAQRVGADLDRAGSVVLLGERDGQLLACANICIEDGAGYFGMFSVLPGLQGGGIGTQMLAEAERLARDNMQLPIMRMTVIDVRDELIAFYERRGYHRTGIHKPFPYGDDRYGIPKRADLRFEILEKDLRHV
ncbi:MAG: GNAT family N-acetyltransferase [Thermomonas sp.]